MENEIRIYNRRWTIGLMLFGIGRYISSTRIEGLDTYSTLFCLGLIIVHSHFRYYKIMKELKRKMSVLLKADLMLYYLLSTQLLSHRSPFIGKTLFGTG